MTDKRQRILAAALQLFCQNGFQNTSTAAISKQAGVATGTLFLYFKSKDELINSLYKETKNAFAGYVQQGINAEATVKTQLLQSWRNAANWALEHVNHFRFLAMFGNSPFIASLTKEEAANEFIFLQDLIAKAVTEEWVTTIDLDLFLALFSGQLHATVSYLNQHAGRVDKDSAIQQAFDVFIKGISRH
ncbi:TetR/AcrR family transcriptional regulator [uncultured Pontibacter sp.]|uniref:TetR/AcrR family transcriptional regulator n=1 Tax=uncultured Pontibacter sp. TaxID=453356 RepID=UPI0026307E5E|nr:TetR/AcrR family transcriptional regulator [uncultured Pontibacter sp.]